MRLAPLFDRQEVLEIVRHLRDEGVLVMHLEEGVDVERDLLSLTNEESVDVSLRVRSDSWFRVGA